MRIYKKNNTTFDLKPNKIKTIIRGLSPGIRLNIKSKKNYEKLSKLINSNAKILVVGGSIKGKGMDVIYSNDSFKKIVYFSTIFVDLTSFFFKYFDYYLLGKPGAYDAASAFFFIGKKTNKF